jgi:hypothetical protein
MEEAFPWIDRANSSFSIEENSPTCLDSIFYRVSSTLLSFPSLHSDWTYPTESNSTMATCGVGHTWSFHGHLRWNASSPFSAAIPLWITDSVNATGEISTAPRFLRGNISGPLDLRWSTLAQADALTRTAWSRSPSALEFLVSQWTALQARRGQDTNVLVLDTTAKPNAWRWFGLDTAILHGILATTTIGSFAVAQTVFSAGDTVWLSPDSNSILQAGFSGTSGEDLYAAVHMMNQTGTSLAGILPLYWSNYSNWLSFQTRTGGTDTSGSLFYLPNGSGNPSTMEIAVAGTCPSQRVWLHEGGSNRSQLPHGNAGPLDGFVCEVHADTLSFPVGQ